MRLANFIVLIIAAFISLVGTANATPLVYAVDSNRDSLYTLDLVTGSAALIGPLHPDSDRYQTPVAMAIRQDGTIFVNNNSPIGDAGLLTVDPGTGLATPLLSGGGDFIDQALAFDDRGILYATDGGLLARVDTITGESDVFGVENLPRLYGLDYNADDGLLYGITGNASSLQLLKIDPDTGAMVTSLALSHAFGGSAAGTLMFDWEGNLWGTVNDYHNNLFQIDPGTGFVSNIHSIDGGYNPQGMGWIDTTTVDEPLVWMLFTLGLLSLAVMRRPAV